jgi:hypothetical protein
MAPIKSQNKTKKIDQKQGQSLRGPVSTQESSKELK